MMCAARKTHSNNNMVSSSTTTTTTTREVLPRPDLRALVYARCLVHRPDKGQRDSFATRDARNHRWADCEHFPPILKPMVILLRELKKDYKSKVAKQVLAILGPAIDVENNVGKINTKARLKRYIAQIQTDHVF